ncbi:MAG: hypothetical protein ACJ763_06470 [Bdellovibrionia bacterium]
MRVAFHYSLLSLFLGGFIGISIPAITYGSEPRSSCVKNSLTSKLSETKTSIAYHASPIVGLTRLDPAFSRNTSRYGPGAYFYFDRKLAEKHAASIQAGQIKYDHAKRSAKIYAGYVDIEHTLDVERVYSLSELQAVISRVNKLKPGRLNDLPEKITGEEFYNRLTHAFQGSKGVSLSRGTVGEIDSKSLANQALIDSGIQTIIGRIPDPDTREWNRAAISLIPVQVQ